MTDDKTEKRLLADIPMPAKGEKKEDIHSKATPVPDGHVRTVPGRHVLLDLLLQLHAQLASEEALKHDIKTTLRFIVLYIKKEMEADGDTLPPEIEDILRG